MPNSDPSPPAQNVRKLGLSSRAHQGALRPGEVVSERDGYVYINGAQLQEPYIKADRRDHEPPRTWTRIPKGYYFFMGDNRGASCDSRVWGPVPRTNLIGEVFFVYWPPTRIGFR